MYSEKKIILIILICLVLIFSLVHYKIVSPLNSPPSPLYGGDLYYELGATNHVKYGGSPLLSSNTKDSLPIYFVLYSAITGNLAKLFSLDAFNAEILFSYVIIILSAIILFFLGWTLFKNYFLAILFPIAFVLSSFMPVLKYTEFAYLVMMPLLLLFLYRFINNYSYLNAIILGLIYGLIGLTHSVAFISSSMLLGLALLYYGLIVNVDRKNKKIDYVSLKKNFAKFAIVLVIGILIAMLWWYKPIFVYHGQTALHYSEWNNGNWKALSMQWSFLWDTITGKFFNFSDLRGIIASTFCLLGILGLFIVKSSKPNENNNTNNNSKISVKNYIAFLLSASLIATFHYFITQNIFGTNYIPGYIAYLLLTPCLLVLFAFGVYVFSLFLQRFKIRKEIIICLIIILLLIGQYSAYKEKQKDRWYANAKLGTPDNYASLKEYLVENSDVNDVILTAKEVGFAVNAITGRKLVVSRRAHNDPFIDMDQRELDAAILLYGNNTETKKELLKKYDVRYLYGDNYWIQSEYQIESGKITGWFDPMILFDDPVKEKILQDNGVKYFKEHTWVDPALHGEEFPQFDLIFISPENYVSGNHPWNNNLDELFTKVWQYPVTGNYNSILYEVKI